MLSRIAVVAVVVALVGCSKEPDQYCSVTCLGDGYGRSAAQCSGEVLRYRSCKAPELVRRPEVGETVFVRSVDEERAAVVLSVGPDGFSVAGPPNAAELGSAVVAQLDGALLGVVEEYSSSLSDCEAP